MSNFFSLFPQIGYDMARTGSANFDLVTNIFFRIAFLNTLKQNSFAYYEYLVKEGETPEIIADKYYGDPEAHWIILISNDIVDPLNDWVLHYEQFNKYLIAKYGSVAASQVQLHHTDMIFRRTDQSGFVTNTSIQIDTTSVNANIANSLPTTPYYYTGNLPLDEPAGIEYELPNGEVVREASFYRQTTCYDVEFEANEQKRKIKLIRKDHYSKIMSEFARLTSTADPGLAFGRRDPNA
jgi:hypothetical protein